MLEAKPYWENKLELAIVILGLLACVLFIANHLIDFIASDAWLNIMQIGSVVVTVLISPWVIYKYLKRPRYPMRFDTQDIGSNAFFRAIMCLMIPVLVWFASMFSLDSLGAFYTYLAGKPAHVEQLMYKHILDTRGGVKYQLLLKEKKNWEFSITLKKDQYQQLGEETLVYIEGRESVLGFWVQRYELLDDE